MITNGKLPARFSGFGAAQIDPVSAGIKVAQLGVGTAATIAAATPGGMIGVSTGAGTMIGLSSLALGGIGIALAAVAVAYQLISNHQAKVKAKRRAREARVKAFYDIGKSLIYEIYGVGIPGWSHSVDTTYPGQYAKVGAHFYYWSNVSSIYEKERAKGVSEKKLADREKKVEERRTKIVGIIKSFGLDPTRFMGAANVRANEELHLMNDFVAEPERALVAKEALDFFGYELSTVDALDQAWSVRLFDMINTMGKVKTEGDAAKVKYDIENHLRLVGLDPLRFFQETTSTLPSPIYSTSQAMEIPVVTVQEAGFSPLLILGLVAGALFMFMGRK